MSQRLSPTEIADLVQDGRPHLSVAYYNSGGNVFVIGAEDQQERVFLFGVGAGYLGYSSEYGDVFGEWPEFAVETEWQNDAPIGYDTASRIVDAIFGVLDAELPAPKVIPPVAWDREETDTCQKGTVGCSVDHPPTVETACATW